MDRGVGSPQRCTRKGCDFVEDGIEWPDDSIDLAPIADQIAALMNAALTADPDAINALLATRVPCNKALADHPTVQVGRESDGWTLGPVGLLNGIAGTQRRIFVVVDEETKRIVRFDVQDFV